MLDRRRNLIKLLLEAKLPLTSTQLSIEMQVSNRTIRNDLVEIEPIIQTHRLKLIKKPRIGIWIEGNLKNKDELYLDITNQVNDKIEQYSKENRRNYILVRLLAEKSRMYISYFADLFYTSNSTIEKDLIYVSHWLSQHNLELRRTEKHGMYIKGKEINIRNAFAIIVSAMEENKKDFNDTMKELFNIEIVNIQKMLSRWNHKWEIGLSESNVKNLAFHIAIMLSRLEKGHGIQYKKAIDKQIVEIRQKKLVKELFEEIAKATQVILPDEEKDYILLHLISITLDNNNPLSSEESLLKLRGLAEGITNEFIYNLEQVVSLGLPNNISLKESLIMHLLPTVFRLKYSLNLYNPLLNEIKRNYASAYALASIINSSFKRKLGVEASEEEIAYIALHVSLAIEKSRDKITIAVVCPMGRGISRFLLIKLEEKFPEVNLLNYSLQDILSKDTSHIDFIVTTIPLEINKPSILINAIVSEDDIYSIRKMLRNLTKDNKKYFSMQTILTLHNKSEKYEVLKLISDKLWQNNYVNSDFIDGVLKREQMSSTEIGNGVVLTHGFYDSVKRTQIAFCKLDKSILWNTQRVNLIVMMAIQKDDSKNVMNMSWLYKTLNNEKALKEILQCKNEEELYNALCNEYSKY